MGVVDIKVGSAVKALAGREKNRLFVAVAVNGGFAEICDGRERKLAKPKRKNVKHISPTGEIIETSGLTDRKLRKLLADLEEKIGQEADRQPL